MSTFVASVANVLLTFTAKSLVKTNCYWACHAPEAPDELF